MPVRERAEKMCGWVCVRENDNKRTEGMAVGCLCSAVKELETESTIQATASPSLTLTQQHKG